LTLAVARLVDQDGVSAWQATDGTFTLVSAHGFAGRRRSAVGAQAPRKGLLNELTASRRLRMLTREEAPAVVRGPLAGVVPIGEREGNHALLVVERGAAFDTAEEALLLGVADQALLALENERLLSEQRDALSGTVACLGRARAAPSRDRRALGPAHVGLRGGRPRARDDRRRPARSDLRRRAPRPRQDRGARAGAGEPRPARQRGLAADPRPPRARRPDHRPRRRPGRRGRADPGLPRALGRQGLPARRGRRGHPARRAHHPRLRRLPRDVRGAQLPGGAAAGGGPRAAARAGRRRLRPACRGRPARPPRGRRLRRRARLRREPVEQENPRIGPIFGALMLVLLVSTVTTPLAGKLGAQFGRKIVLQTALATFLLGSALCGAAHGMTELIAFRAFQGLGGGGLIVTTQAAIGDVVPARDRGRYAGLLGGVFGLSTVIGPLLGGFFVDNLSWRWIFYVNIPIGVVALIVLQVVFHPPGVRTRHVIDYL